MKKKIQIVILGTLLSISPSIASDYPLERTISNGLTPTHQAPLPQIINQETIADAKQQISQTTTIDGLKQVTSSLRDSLQCPKLSWFMSDDELAQYPGVAPISSALFDQMCKIQQRGKYRPSAISQAFHSTQMGFYGMFYSVYQCFENLYK